MPVTAASELFVTVDVVVNDGRRVGDRDVDLRQRPRDEVVRHAERDAVVPAALRRERDEAGHFAERRRVPDRADPDAQRDVHRREPAAGATVTDDCDGVSECGEPPRSRSRR